MRTFNIVFIVMATVVIFCNLWSTFVYDRAKSKYLSKFPPIQTVEQRRGEMTYLVFLGPNGELHSVNYSLDSMDFEMHKKFDK